MGVSEVDTQHSKTYIEARTRCPHATFKSTDGGHFHRPAAGHCVPVRIPRHPAQNFQTETSRHTKYTPLRSSHYCTKPEPAYGP